MKKDYTLASGKTVELDVTAEVGEILVQFEREDDNEKRYARRRNDASVEGMFEETGWEPTDKSVDIEADYMATEGTETLLTAIAGLSEKQQRIVRRKYYENKTDAEIAAELGVSRPAVTQQIGTIHRALKKYFENV